MRSPEIIAADLRALRENEQRTRDEIRDLRRARADAERLLSSVSQAKQTLDQIRSETKTLREAVRILGPRGVRRRIAEDALDEIAAGANELLARAGVELSVGFRWERETKGLASACDDCGAPFPPSAKVRACSRCHAERGPKLDERLDVVLSTRSGAAEDLAGVALSLSASARLRAERGSSWGLVCLDEPFGALDRSHRRGLSRGLVSMFRGQWEQALVIAHDDAVMDGMPGKIVIVGGEHGSRIESG